MGAKVIKAVDMGAAPPIAEALNGWRAAQAGPVFDPVVALIDAEILQWAQVAVKLQSKGFNSGEVEAYIDGLNEAKRLHQMQANPPRSDE